MFIHLLQAGISQDRYLFCVSSIRSGKNQHEKSKACKMFCKISFAQTSD